MQRVVVGVGWVGLGWVGWCGGAALWRWAGLSSAVVSVVPGWLVVGGW